MTGKHSWEGIEILIFGEEPILPMKIERQIAAAAPYDEIRLESFESFEDALDYCNKSKKVGLFFFIGKNQSINYWSKLFDVLSLPYVSKTEWPALSVIIYENSVTDKSIKPLLIKQNGFDYPRRDV
jgi:hypothetical protein